MKVSYTDYIEEIRRIEETLENRTCVKGIKDKISFTNRSGCTEPIKLFVNFACLGAVEPIVASRYAYCIKEAAELAKSFKYNGYILE